MALTPELSKQIDQRMLELLKENYLRTGTSQQKFLDYLIAIITQATKDKTALINAGFPESNFVLYSGFQEVLVLTYGQRYGTVEQAPEQKTYFEVQYALAVTEKKRMMVVARHIVDKCQDWKVEKLYKQIVKGDSISDTLLDNISLDTLISAHLNYAAEIKPAGTTIDKSYTKAAADRAVELLSLKGFVIERGVPVNIQVDRLNRITTLCINAIAEIRKYAGAAFIDDPEYLKTNYPALKSGSNDEPANETDKKETPVTAATVA